MRMLLVDAGQGNYRLSLMDFGMPRPKPQGLDGTEAEERMRDVSYTAPELLVTTRGLARVLAQLTVLPGAVHIEQHTPAA